MMEECMTTKEKLEELETQFFELSEELEDLRRSSNAKSETLKKRIDAKAKEVNEVLAQISKLEGHAI